jgi:hypothetical protein
MADLPGCGGLQHISGHRVPIKAARVTPGMSSAESRYY